MQPHKRRKLNVASLAVVAAAALPHAAAQLQVQPTIAPTILPAANITVYGTSAASTFAAGPSLAPSVGTSPQATNDSAAGNSPILIPPAIPAGLPTQITLDLTGPPQNLSRIVKAPFVGLSIELSVVPQVIGKNGTNLHVPFLNYIENIRSRAGSGPIIRLGGNTQDSSTYNATALVAVQTTQIASTVQSVDTPNVQLGPEFFNIMRNVTDTVDAHWVFGINFNQPDANAVQTAAIAQTQLGSSLVTLELGNEPDLYVSHETRPSDYSIDSYVVEWGTEVKDITAGPGFNGQHAFAGPSVCCEWNIDDVLSAGYLQNYSSSLGVLSVQHYPDNNCAATGKTTGTPKPPQAVFHNYLNHTGAVWFIEGYDNASAAAVGADIPFMMLETNTASCGGFPGVSDSFGAAIWTIDYALALAVRNFSATLFHIGGPNVYYNAFTAPPTNQSSFRGWDTGSIYYGFLVVAEALGPKQTSQVAELEMVASDSNGSYAGYLISEGGTAQRAVLLNYVSGAAPYTAQLTMPSSTSSVVVKYLLAPSTAVHYNITWAGQIFGGNTSFSSQGLPLGDLQTSTIPCQVFGTSSTCNIPVPAPAVALVGLTSDAASQISSPPNSTQGFPTTTAASATLTIDPSALATSNGMIGEVRGPAGDLGGTSAIRSLALRLSAAAVPWTVIILIITVYLAHR